MIDLRFFRLGIWIFGVASCLSCQSETPGTGADKNIAEVVDTFAYEQLLPDSLQLQLPQMLIDSSLLEARSMKTTVDCFLGYRSGTTDTTYQMQFALGFKGNGPAKYADIPHWVKEAKASQPDSLQNRLWVDLWIDQDIPYFAVHYLEMCLRKEELLSINYRTADGKRLPVRLPPFSANECYRMSGRPCLKKWPLTETEKVTLNNMDLRADWLPTLRYEDFVLRPENVFKLGIKADDKLLLNGTPLRSDSLFANAYTFLHGPGSPATKIFRMQITGEARFAHFLNSYIALKQVYQMTWEEAAQELFSKSYSSLARREKTQVRTKWPFVIMVEKV